MKRKILWLALLLFLTAEGYAQDAGQMPLRLTLEECLEYAFWNNNTRQVVKLNEEVRESSLDQSRMDRLPNLSANISESVSGTKAGSTSWNGGYDLSASVTLFQGGQINNTIRQNELQYEQTRLQTRQYDNELTIQILQSFLSVIANEELLKYQESILDASEKQAKEGRIKFGAGQILESDYLLLEAQYAADLDNITTTRISFNNSLVSLKNLMGMELAQAVILVYPDDSALESLFFMPSEEEVVIRGMETLPDVKISDYNVEIAETGLKISRSSLYPTVSLSGGVGTGHARNFSNYGTQLSDNFGPQGGITVSIPIFNRNKTRTNIKQGQIAVRQAELEKRQSMTDIEQTLINEYGNVTASGSKYKASEIRQNAYSSSFQAYSEMFKAGSITAVELLQQQNNYISAVNDYIQNKYSFILQRKVLDVYMGERIVM